MCYYTDSIYGEGEEGREKGRKRERALRAECERGQRLTGKDVWRITWRENDIVR